ncbi:NACHT domain-containing protein [uncultured Stenotrophomonas sp.]|uniref:NACHT domain-containing protein n=1 Tax=uncultured Stenotrophomonas sp. TaxID=165438 RepID=UPI0028D034FC|nr:NACHT domain-containing protein [uncultured Stenotrophomonas sp.]
MTNTRTADLISALASNFKHVRYAGEIDVRESLALIDFYLRVIYTLHMSFDRRQPSSTVRLLPTPGFGSMLAVVRGAAKSTGGASSSWISASIRTLAQNAVKAIDAFRVVNKYANFKSLRDRLSHGGSLSSDPDTKAKLHEATSNLIEHLRRALSEVLSDTSLKERDGRLWMTKIGDAAELEVSPLWIMRGPSEALGIFSHFADDRIFYFAPEGDLWTEGDQESTSRFRRLFLPDKGNPGPYLARLVTDTLSDVSAYTEDYSTPSYFFGDDDRAGYLHVPWSRTTSEGYESRIDVFRIGQNHRREWECGSGKWSGYSEFLKHISKWELLARRIGIGLHTLQQSREDEETSRLGITDRTMARGPSKLKEVHDVGGNPEPVDGNNFFELGGRIDSACEAIKPSTSVFFLVGQAGLGKTELMLRLARERAASVADDPQNNRPLYLFVSSTGRTLSSLEDAVNSALNITRVLSSHSARALCRNGLLVLMVDGFDELLGGSGYENALGSLEPWFRDLNGQGVLVASARSSYYLTQYRRSLVEAVDLNVDHTLIELQPWSKSESSTFLSNAGVRQEIMNDLSAKDWKVLSVPFFAKAFAAWIKLNLGNPVQMPAMYEIVVDQFLDREASKLRNQNSDELLSINELRELFAEVADYMQSSKSRELEQSELVSCAKMIVGEPLDDVRPGLSRRLSSLGGLGVRADENGNNLFGFSHEVLFDCFLLLAIQRRLSGVLNTKSLLAMITASSINEAVFEWLIEKYPEAAATLSKNLDFNLDSDVEARVASANLGALWKTILKHQDGVPPTKSARSLAIGSVELSNSGWSELDLSGSSVAHLTIPDRMSGSVDVRNTLIEYLDIHSASLSKNSIQNIDHAEVSSLKIGGVFADGPAQVNALLQKAGLVQKIVASKDEQLVEAAEHYLSRLKRRPDVPVIIDRDNKTADDARLSWITHYDSYFWTSFVDALVASGAAVLEALPASGRAKVRLSPVISFDKLIKRDSTSEESTKFWSML